MDYCDKQGIPYRRVDCHASNIIPQLKGCDGLMWHHGQSDPHDILIARPVLSALEHAGIPVFPDFRTAWHFDDKVAQKYLFEALDLPTVPAHVFVDRDKAMAWIDQIDFPMVFKLRRGASSAGVKLVETRRQARRLVRRAFGRGFTIYDPWGNLRERIYKVRLGKLPATSIFNGMVRLVYPPRYSKILGPERGYAYFQDYLPGNDSDIRIIVVGDRAAGIRRMVRPGDFRASGSGLISYEREDLDEQCVTIAFETADRLGCESVALDFLYDQDGHPKILEASYGFVNKFNDPCTGYWDRDMNWHPGPFDPQGWMVELLLKRIQEGR